MTKNRGAQVGLLDDQADGHREDQRRHGEIEPAHRALALVEVPREHERHGKPHDLGRLNAGDADVEPARGALDGDALELDCEQQQHPDRVGRRGELHQRGRRQHREGDHHRRRHREVAHLVVEAAGKIGTGRIQREQAHRHQAAHDAQQHRIEHRDAVACPMRETQAERGFSHS
jgi:hypothetical protein